MKRTSHRNARPLRIAGFTAATLALLVALPWQVTAQTPPTEAKNIAVGTWKSKEMAYTFNDKGEYLAMWGDMDHQGTYRVKGRQILITPTVVAQRPAAQWLRDLTKDPERLTPEDRALGRQVAKPYAMKLSADGKTLTGLGFKVKLDPKAKPLF